MSYNGASNASASVRVPLLDTGIAWDSDKNVKFKNPPNWDNTIKPKNWQRNVSSLSTDPSNNGYKNEDLIVWMRTAALPTFRKFHRRVDHSTAANFTTGLPAGYYTIRINYSTVLLFHR